ncbi:MAG: hypothetical protein QOE36_526 [Gaiellaceae bacterium]|nr:hypothetical protein [Gaiellaceae bacterium]
MLRRCPTSDRRAADAWDRLAARYGAQERLETRAVDAALRLAVSAPAERLVDLATGTGLVLRRLAVMPARPRIAIGVDSSARMLARVGALPAGWSTSRADARRVPLPSAWADVVVCSYLLQLLEPAERAGVLAEARRLLRPAQTARLVTVTVWADESGARGRLLSRALSGAARARPAAWGGLRPLDPTRDLTAAGFAVTRRVVVPRRGYPSLVLAAGPARGG